MKKTMVLAILLTMLFSSHAEALSWAYSFVVWDGKLYEVKQDVNVPENEIAEAIGQVKTAADDMSGAYYGNASNYYEKGTVYYAIRDVPTDESIAVETNEGIFVKAEYRQQAAFHFMNIFTSFWFWAALPSVFLISLYFYKTSSRNKRATL